MDVAFAQQHISLPSLNLDLQVHVALGRLYHSKHQVMSEYIYYDDNFGTDSKTLTEAQRDQMFASIKKDKTIGWQVIPISPEELSTKMLKLYISCIRECDS